MRLERITPQTSKEDIVKIYNNAVGDIERGFLRISRELEELKRRRA